MIATVHIQ